MTDERTAALTVDCFKNQPQVNFRCSVNGGPVSAFEYVLCRYEEAFLVNGNSAADRAKAGMKMNQLESALLGLLAEIQDKLLTPAEVQVQWRQRLAQYNLPGLDISTFVLTTLQSCYTKATNETASERTNPSSPYYRK